MYELTNVICHVSKIADMASEQGLAIDPINLPDRLNLKKVRIDQSLENICINTRMASYSILLSYTVENNKCHSQSRS